MKVIWITNILSWEGGRSLRFWIHSILISEK